MPELPEVETVRRGLSPLITGARIDHVTLNRPNLRFAFPKDFADRLAGRRITAVNRRAKYLLIELDDGMTLLSHLGMTGNFRVADMPLDQPSRYHAPLVPGKHDHVLIGLRHADGRAADLIYSDPRRFGFMDLFADPGDCAFLNRLGPEPLGNELTAIAVAKCFAGRKTPVKAALLDQRNIAGLGNIYVCEALWRSGIAPQTPAGNLVLADGQPRAELEALVGAIRDVLGEAIAAGGSTLKDFRNADGGAGYFQHSFDVYDRRDSPCRTKGCDGTITRIVQSGRSSFYCPQCQVEIS